MSLRQEIQALLVHLDALEDAGQEPGGRAAELLVGALSEVSDLAVCVRGEWLHTARDGICRADPLGANTHWVHGTGYVAQGRLAVAEQYATVQIHLTTSRESLHPTD